VAPLPVSMAGVYHLRPPTSRPQLLIRVASRSILFVLTPVLLAAQTPGTGVVAGRVVARVDTTAVLAARGATISIVGTALVTTTDANGGFLIDRVTPGSAIVRVRLLGYRMVDRAIDVRGGDTVRLDIVLVPEAQLLTPVRVDARATDLETFVSKPNVATVTIDAAAMAGVPSIGEPDVVRVAQLLPGVVARNDFNTGLNVRGGEADQNLILLDGHPIYNPFHLGGVFSTFMDATVGGIELMTGAFPARYGGRLSSVLDVRSAEDARPGVHLSADISALAATGRLTGSLGGDRGMWSLAGRRTYADAVTSLFTNDIFPYHFRDFHGRATYALSETVRLAVTGYMGRDVLDANLAEFEADSAPSSASEGRWTFDWGNRVLGAAISNDLPSGVPFFGWRLGESATIEQRVSISDFSTLLDVGDGALAERSDVREWRLSGSLLTRGARHDVTMGYDVASHRLRYASGSSQTATREFDLVQRPVTAALWIDDLWRVSPRWLLEWGLRAEGLTGRDWVALSPRVSLKYFATPSFAITAGVGRVAQWMHSLAGDGPYRYFDIWIASDEYTPVATAWHWVAGVEKRLGDAGSVRVEGYVKQLARVLEANWSENPSRRGDEFFAADGRSYGVDLLARWQPPGGVAGWIAYSYGVSSRWRDGVRWAPGHDRRHDVDVVATWNLGKYRLGARAGFATGTPYTPIVGEIARRVYDPSRDSWGTGDPPIRIEPLGGARHGDRFPATHRLDVDASREFRLRRAVLVPYISLVNVYNAKNIFVYLYDYSTDRPTRRAISQFPILPSAGVRVVF
jgi:hypothetical protein